MRGRGEVGQALWGCEGQGQDHRVEGASGWLALGRVEGRTRGGGGQSRSGYRIEPCHVAANRVLGLLEPIAPCNVAADKVLRLATVEIQIGGACRRQLIKTEWGPAQ